jgi:hypothetical protein
LPLAGVVAKLSLVFNLARGPWNQGDFGRQMREGAQVFQEMLTSDADIVQEMLPHIAFDKGLSECTAGLAEDVLRELTTLPAFSANGTHVTLRRWFSWTYAWEELDPQFSTMAMVLRWMASQSVSWEFEQWASADGAEALSAAELRAKCSNTLECAARVLQDKSVQLFARMISAVARPVRNDHLRAIDSLTSQNGAASFNANRSNGEWVETVQSMAALLRDPTLLQQCGICVACPLLRIRFGASQALAQKLFKLVVHAMSQRCWSMSYHSTCLPDAAFGVLSATAAAAKRCLRFLRKIHDAVLAAEQLVNASAAEGWEVGPADAQLLAQAAGGQDGQAGPTAAPRAPAVILRACLDDLAWNSLQICREVLGAARDSSWDYRNPVLRSFIWDLSATECNTKRVNEDVFKILREAEGENENKRVSYQRMHYLAGPLRFFPPAP